MTTPSFDFAIAGAGIIGLATAKALKQAHPKSKILIIEKEPAPGLHASGRNSGVLHCGIFYNPDTLKANFCSSGARQMLQFAREHDVPCKVTGKVILAQNDDQLLDLNQLAEWALQKDIRVHWISGEETKRLEPACAEATDALYCSDTAVIDPKALVARLAEYLAGQGVEFWFDSKWTGVDKTETHATTTGYFNCGTFFNCAGAYADSIATACGVQHKYKLIPFKGIYYKLAPRVADRIRGNIYPVPDLSFPFLGPHFTRSIDGNVYVGPTAIPALGRENYSRIEGLSPFEAIGNLASISRLLITDKKNLKAIVAGEVRKYRRSGFLEDVKPLVPEIREEDLIRSGKVGIRPQLVNLESRELEIDFVIIRRPGAIHVLNAISPAFTCAFPFTKEIVSGIE